MASFFLISLRAQLMTAFFEYFIGQLLQHCCGPWLEPNSVLITVVRCEIHFMLQQHSSIYCPPSRQVAKFLRYHETAETGFQERTEPGLGYGRGDKVSTVVTVHVFLLGLDKLKTLYRIICAPKEPRKGTPPEYFGTLADVLGPFPLLVSADRACPTRKGFPSQEFAVEDICLDVGYQLVMGHNVQNQQQIR
ncbi:hypothetical protein I7I51_05669 [Histoplasma capsulatum]|uniref:Uncharacterized protein n=1 Tax=Ajellomyces capsulatus TaxID=5037 RepID=A0A8A1M8C5_AJECA|nr:hypothetical protein I7I51_05669 [Histoplasma capsulatum]